LLDPKGGPVNMARNGYTVNNNNINANANANAHRSPVHNNVATNNNTDLLNRKTPAA
jgi:hypothetical protein